MFYGIPEDKHDAFKQAYNTIKDIFPEIYAADMLITLSRNQSFKIDTKFTDSFMSFAETEQEHSLIWRLHTLAWAAGHAMNIEGDFVECGVLKGFCSKVICKYLDFGNSEKQFYLYDTFSGLPEETSTQQEREGWDYTDLDTEELLQEVHEAFSGYENVNIIPGMVPQTFETAVPDEISFLHIDMNSEQAEIQALEHLFDRVTTGGIIVLDDFGWIANRNQMISELKFMAEREHMVLELPTGQGMVIKHRKNHG